MSDMSSGVYFKDHTYLKRVVNKALLILQDDHKEQKDLVEQERKRQEEHNKKSFWSKLYIFFTTGEDLYDDFEYYRLTRHLYRIEQELKWFEKFDAMISEAVIHGTEIFITSDDLEKLTSHE